LHGHPVSVRRVRYVKRRVRRCFAATARRRVLVVLKRHGKVVRQHGHVVRVHRIRRVVLVPHRVYRTVREIHHGHGSTVSGLLLLSDGTPLVGQTITILGAPNIGAGLQFTAVSSAVTDADGYWVAKIPAGPSRILEAQYGGTSTTAPASSETVKLRVPARLAILSHTTRVAWGETVRFTGRLYGGYIPRGGVNVELRYGYGKSWATYGVKTRVQVTDASGRRSRSVPATRAITSASTSSSRPCRAAHTHGRRPRAISLTSRSAGILTPTIITAHAGDTIDSNHSNHNTVR
jgi:hypothetical protein